MPQRGAFAPARQQNGEVSAGTSTRKLAGLLLSALVLLAPSAAAQRTHLKPPWNIYGPGTDIQVGKQFALQVEKQYPLCNAPKVDAYLTQLGLKLAAKLPTNGVQYPWEFHCVNDKAINAFALPGGYVFVNRGTIEAADNEAQLAAVMAHELSHVALRHGTAQASKAELAQGAAGLLGGIFGGGRGGELLARGASLGAGSLLLHYSRSAETQADVMGTQVLYDAGYDPRAMAQFFEKLQAQGGQGGNLAQFFSDHPSPDHRVERVDKEVEKLGGPPASYKRDSTEFQAIRREVLTLPAPPKARTGGAAAGGKPPAPSATFAVYEGTEFSLKYPDNWRKYGDGNAISLAPEGGVVQDRSGQAALAYGMIVNMADAHEDGDSEKALEEYTDRLIDQLQHSNPNMRVMRKAERIHLNGQPALSTYLTNASPVGGQETDWVITVLRPEGLLYFVCVAPQADYDNYDKTFASILDTVRLAK